MFIGSPAYRKNEPEVDGVASPDGYSDAADVLPGMYPPLGDDALGTDALGTDALGTDALDTGADGAVNEGDTLAVENEGAGAAGGANCDDG